MRQYLLTTAAIMCSWPALGADIYLPTKAPPAPPAVVYASWTGLYIGVDAGYGWSGSTVTTTGTDPVSQKIIAAGLQHGIPNSLKLDGDGGLGGAHMGYNFQMGPVVLGIETDVMFTGIAGNDSWHGGFPLGQGARQRNIPVSQTAHNELDWLGTTRARVGYLVLPALLVYGTAGVAYGDVQSATNISIGNAFTSTSFDEMRCGWVAGAGAEYALQHNWSLRSEFLFYDLGSSKWTQQVNGLATHPFAVSATNAGALVRGGMSYKF